ncbi:MAG: chemotaxis protein CheW [Cyanobacteria bacterium P01_F01_bin.150]
MTSGTASIDRLKDLLPQLLAPSAVTGELFLHIELTADLTVGYPMRLVEEVQTVSMNSIIPIPNMQEQILGLVQSKGYIFWLVDLAHLLGLPPLHSRRRQYEMIMTNLDSSSLNKTLSTTATDQHYLGFAAKKIRGTFRVNPDRISPVKSGFHSELSSCIFGIFDDNGKTIPLINV